MESDEDDDIEDLTMSRPNDSGDRVKAVDSLIWTIRRKFPEKGFICSHKLEFVLTKDKGLYIRANKPIYEDETLMVLPDESRLGHQKVLGNGNTSKIVQANIKQVRILHRDLNAQRKHQELQKYLSPEDFLLAISLMKILSMKYRGEDNDDLSMNIAQAATWPSEEAMKQSSWFYWDVSRVQSIWNQSGLYFGYEELMNDVRSTFDDVLFPFFKKQGRVKDYIDASLPSNASIKEDANNKSPFNTMKEDENNNKKALWNTFIYALSLSWSRSHENEHGHPEMIPLVELFNGHSDRINQVFKKSKNKNDHVINLGLARGFWPFIGGDKFVNECDLACSCVYASRDIDEGEELILSYGDVSPTGFVAKYGSMPHDFLNHFNIQSDVSLWTPPEFIPTETMRVKCLERSSYPLEILKGGKGGTALGHLICERDNIQLHNNGHETEMIKSIRQYLILAVLADDFELERNYNTGL